MSPPACCSCRAPCSRSPRDCCSAWVGAWCGQRSAASSAQSPDFSVARYLNAGHIDAAGSARLRPILDRVERGGWRAVALLRLIPVVPHSLANYGLGLTRVRLGAYAFGSLIGQLPMTVACVDLGAAGERLALGRPGWVVPTAIGAAALAVSLLVPAVARRRAG